MRFLVRILPYGGNYSAMAPDLPGCVVAGDSVEEVRQLMTEAIYLHLDLMSQSGEKLPAPTNPVDLNLDDLEEGELYTWVEVAMPEAMSSQATT